MKYSNIKLYFHSNEWGGVNPKSELFGIEFDSIDINLWEDCVRFITIQIIGVKEGSTKDFDKIHIYFLVMSSLV